MTKHCETFAHTSDVGLRATAETPAGLFEALAEGLADYLCPRRKVAAAATRTISAEAEDLEALAVDFLTDVMNLIQTDRFMVSRVSIAEVRQNRIAARIHGEPYDPARHELSGEVKAVTYHQLEVAQAGDVWTASVVLDI